MRFPSFYRHLFRPILFLFDAENAHHFVFRIASIFWRSAMARKLTRQVYVRNIADMPTQLGALTLPNPLGLAAGFDKNAILIPGLDSLGFGFLEIGTVTPRPQAGNPKPRMFRIPDKQALLNKMGFNNDGAQEIFERLKKNRSLVSVPIGVNLGKNKDTPNSLAVEDYESLFKTFQSIASYFVINISSPNTPGLRDLQSEEFARKLGEKISELKITQPVFLKLAPELEAENLKAICQLCGSGAGKFYSGLVLTNTLSTDLGGLSGLPLKGPSLFALKLARGFLPPEVPIISVGGLQTGADLFERLEHGANAAQLYSHLVYEGPSLPGRILREFYSILRQKGVRKLADLRRF